MFSSTRKNRKKEKANGTAFLQLMLHLEDTKKNLLKPFRLCLTRGRPQKNLEGVEGPKGIMRKHWKRFLSKMLIKDYMW